MLLETSFQGAVRVRISDSDDPYCLIVSSDDDLDKTVNEFFKDSPFPEKDRAKLSSTLRDVQLEICKLELAFTKKAFAKRVKMQNTTEFESDEEESKADERLSVNIKVPRTHEAKVRFSGLESSLSVNEMKLEESNPRDFLERYNYKTEDPPIDEAQRAAGIFDAGEVNQSNKENVFNNVCRQFA